MGWILITEDKAFVAGLGTVDIVLAVVLREVTEEFEEETGDRGGPSISCLRVLQFEQDDCGAVDTGTESASTLAPGNKRALLPVAVGRPLFLTCSKGLSL